MSYILYFSTSIGMDDKSAADKEFAEELDLFYSTLSKLSTNSEDLQACVKEVFGENPNTKPQRSNYVCSSSTIFCAFHFIRSCLKFIVTCIFAIVFIYLFVTSHNSVQKIILRNSQNYIYPVMRTLRIWTLPVLRKFEFLSGKLNIVMKIIKAFIILIL